MLGFGGGVMDMLTSQGITARELIKLMVYLIPIVLAYSLPVAALFGTTITYGRFSADNEINACRASGINIYRLFMPVMILSVFVSGITFSLENYWIPDLASRIEQIVKRDIPTIAYMELKNRRYMSRMNYAIHCGKVEDFVQPELQPDGTYSPGQIQLANVAFLRHKGDIPVFYGTAKTALILFENYHKTPSVSVHLNQVRAFNEERGEMIQAGYYPIGPIPIKDMTTKKLKFLSLPVLLDIRKDPFKFPKLQEAKESLYATLRIYMAYEYYTNQLTKQGQCEFKDPRNRCVVTAESYRRTGKDGRIVLEGNVTLDYRPIDGPPAKFTAKEAVVTMSSLSDDLPPTANIEMKDVKVTETRSGNVHRYANHDRYSIGPLEISAAATEPASETKLTVNQLTSPELVLANSEVLKMKRYYVAREKVATLTKCIAEIHSRMSYSVSGLVLLLLGAGLGIIFRGGHFVSAFGLSFIPMMFVVVMIMMGKQLSTSGMLQAGLFVMWLGLAIVALADFLVLGKFLRR
jgi:lipopolysaccharide export LptBFGC system permease protein LptF